MTLDAEQLKYISEIISTITFSLLVGFYFWVWMKYANET